MDSNLKNMAAGVVGTKVMRNFRFRWVLYGAAVYAGLRFMSKKGIMKDQADAALGFIDKGIDMAKTQLGIPVSSRAGTNRANAGEVSQASLSH